MLKRRFDGQPFLHHTTNFRILTAVDTIAVPKGQHASSRPQINQQVIPLQSPEGSIQQVPRNEDPS